MSKKTITKLLNCAVRDKAGQLAITSRPDRFFLDYLRPDGQKRNLSWKHHQEKDLLDSWRRIFDIAPGELVAKKYCRISNGRQSFNFYLTIRPEANGEKLIIDIAKPSIRIWRLSQLGLQTEDKRELEKILKSRSGLVIISSPPENGKSATLQALLLSLNDPSKNICLLDNHPAYEVPGINAMRLDPANWERVRHHDAEIVLAENLDSGNNLKEAILTATTGRLVIGTIQAEDSLTALRRLLDVDLPAALKLDSLKAIIGERLAPLKRSVRSGRKDGRQVIGLFEILKMTSELKRQLLADTDGGRRIKETGWRRLIAKSGFRSWEDDRKKKIKAGLI
jgi:type II secretory ATPase GspE/PulE/Tfp pilus assembly ATPase PilB-like protein